MPTPSKGESKKKFVSRCIGVVKNEDPSTSDAHAAAKCYGIWDQHQKKAALRATLDFRAMSLDQKVALVRADFDLAYGMEPPYLYPFQIYEDYLIVGYKGRYVKIGYAIENNIAYFDDPEEWTLVEMEFKGLLVPEQPRVVVPQPIRSIGNDRYKVYAVKFGDVEHKDLIGTYFTKETNYYLDWYKSRPWLYHHGLNPHVGAVRIGEWGEAAMDDDGVFLEGELRKAFEYREDIKYLLDEEALYPSSGSLGYLVKVADDGWVSDWPIAEVSSTVTPAEFRIGPFKPAVIKAVNVLQGGIEMSEALGGVRKALDRLVGKRDAEPAVEEAPAVVVAADAETEEEETPVAETKEEEEETPISEPAPEARSAEFTTLVENQGKLVEAVTGLDQLLQTQAAEIKALRQTVEELTKSKAEQIKTALATGQGDWFQSLYINSQQGKEQPRSAPQAVVESQEDGEDGGSPYLQIRKAQGLGS